MTGHTYGDELRPRTELQLRAERLAAELHQRHRLRYSLDTGARPLFWRPAGDKRPPAWPWLLGLAVAFVVLHLVFVG